MFVLKFVSVSIVVSEVNPGFCLPDIVYVYMCSDWYVF